MTEVLITSSALILALLVLRRVFREKISRRAQYALWLLALVRLLVPVSLPTGDFGVLSAAAPAVEAASDRLESRAVYVLPLDRAPAAEIPAADRAQPGEVLTTGDSFGYPVLSEDGATVTRYAQRLTAPELLRWVWYGGMAVMGLWFLVGNLRFRWKLRRRRRPYPVEDCPLPVYLVEGWLPSPCLVGLLRPAIYLTPAAIESEERRRHVIAHELTHRRHLDPLWTLLRSVCLTVYWFDPLVWAAALASRTDGELACDEAVLAGLDQEERLAYGRSLLALIPVRRSGGDPMLAATTMTSGKRQMKDRISRIAQSRRTTALALALVLALCAAACAATFTGPAGDGDSGGGPAALGGESPSAGGDGPLTGEELTFFATEWFNAGGIRNQFLTSFYDSPEDIDLFQLFYCGNGLEETISDQELAEEGNWDEAGSLICALVKNSRTNMDAVLTQYMGLTLAETNQVGLEDFSYREEYDAYYESHGDTNYYLQVDITAGVREGDLIRLYYKETYFGGKRGGWACVTLRDLGDGTYHFVSNQICEKPVVPTVYPAEGLDLTISLADAEVWPLEPAETVRHSDDWAEALGVWKCSGRTVWYYRSTSREYHVGLGTGSGETADVFLTFPKDEGMPNLSASFYYDRFGYDGLAFSYDGKKCPNSYGTITDYWAIPEEGGPILLARAPGDDAVMVDLDGDGVEEMAYSHYYSGAHLWYLGDDGQIRHADIGALLAERWPESTYTRFGSWNELGRVLPLTGQVEVSYGSGVTGTAFRDLYFDGESLLLYRDTRTHTDHVMEGVKAPDDVLAAAKAAALDRIKKERPDELGGYDDWRIESVDGPWTVTAGPLTLETWSFNFEWHATAPTNFEWQTTDPTFVLMAGGRYITEDGWVSPGYPGCDYLYFLLNEEGEREFLYTRMENDCSPGTEGFFCDMAVDLVRLDLLSYADLSGKELLEMMYLQPTYLLEQLAQAPEEDCQAALDTLIVYLSDEAISQEDAERYQSSVDYMGVFSDDASPEALALWETIQTAVAAQP